MGMLNGTVSTSSPALRISLLQVPIPSVVQGVSRCGEEAPGEDLGAWCPV